MGHRSGIILVSAALWLAATTAVANDASLSVAAWPKVSTHGEIKLRVQFDRDQHNRALVVEVNSVDLFRSSTITLDRNSPSVQWFVLKSLPAGDYTAVATLYRNDRATVAADDSFTVRWRAPANPRN